MRLSQLCAALRHRAPFTAPQHEMLSKFNVTSADFPPGGAA